MHSFIVDYTLPHINEITEDLETDCDLTKVYKMNTKPRGYCLIVNMRQDRPGSIKDEKDLKRVFKKLHFRVKVYPNLTKASVEKLLNQVNDTDHTELCCFIMFILAHGTTICNEHFFQTADRNFMKVSYVENKIRKVESLGEKPKLLFVGPCRGDKYDYGTATRDSTAMIIHDSFNDGPNNDDNRGARGSYPIFSFASAFVRYSAAIKDYVACRDDPEGTRFVQSIVTIFEDEQCTRNCDLMNLLVKVTADMKQKYRHRIIQIPEISQSTFDKKLFFGRPKGKLSTCFFMHA